MTGGSVRDYSVRARMLIINRSIRNTRHDARSFYTRTLPVAYTAYFQNKRIC